MSEVRRVIEKAEPLVSVVIPSRDGNRGGNVRRLLDDLGGQTVQDFEVVIAIGFSPNGHARNQGVKEARGQYLVCIDDDVTLGHERVLENLLRPFEKSEVRSEKSEVRSEKSEARSEKPGQGKGDPQTKELGEFQQMGIREGRQRNAERQKGRSAEDGRRANVEHRTLNVEHRTSNGVDCDQQSAMSHQPVATRHSPLVTRHLPLATRHSPLVTRHSPLVTRHSPLVTRHSPLATRHSPLATRHSPLVTRPIGMTGPSQLIPPWQPAWVHWAARQLPRSFFPVADRLTDSDMVSHMCLCMPTQLYKDVGWENDEIVRGTDTDLRYRVRQAGYRIVVVPDTWAYHPLPGTPWKLLKMWFDKGKWTAYNRRHFPGFHFEAPDGEARDFVALRSMKYRVARYGFRMMAALATVKPVRLATQVAYVCGYAKGLVTTETYGS